MAVLLEGKGLASVLLNNLEEHISCYKNKGYRSPFLQVILVGSNDSSSIYIRNKIQVCSQIGINSSVCRLSADITTEVLKKHLCEYNNDNSIDGILVQLPLPPQIDLLSIIEAIDPSKDVDGLHPLHIGRLVMGKKDVIPCTAQAILALLSYYKIPVEGKSVVMIGLSLIVGSPTALLLSNEYEGGKATVTMCHKYTSNLASHTQKADILISAVGIPGIIREDMVKPKSVVIDVGITRVYRNGRYKLLGDCCFQEISDKASHITPVPGGIGPITVAMLMKNTFQGLSKIWNY